MPPWNPTKTKVQLRIAVQRLRMIQQKKEAQAKSSRRDIATLLESKKLEKARVKVETIINEDIHVELLELLELYCELLLARFGLLEQNTKEPDPGIVEGVCCIIHAAPRTELKELHILRDMLMHKYGREFSAAVMENRDGCVSERVVKKLAIGTPPPDLVDAYLGEIAKGYGVEWAPPPVQKDDSEDDVASGGLKESVPRLEPPLKALDPVSAEKLSPTTPALPDLPPTVDADADRTNRTNAASKGAGRVSPPATKPEDEDPFTALSRRFDALKKK